MSGVRTPSLDPVLFGGLAVSLGRSPIRPASRRQPIDRSARLVVPGDHPAVVSGSTSMVTSDTTWHAIEEKPTMMSGFDRIADSTRTSRHVRFVPILLQKSKIEQP
jgi:hypothetical protein